VLKIAGAERSVQSRLRRLLTLCCLTAVVALLATACASAPIPVSKAPPGSGPRTVPKPTDCTASLADPKRAQEGLDAAQPGQKLCIFGQYVQGAELTVRKSGTAAQPVQVVSDGSTMTTIHIQADNVVVEGFNTQGGRGIKARGNNITIRNNDVRSATDDGIRCSLCTNSMIEGNTVRDADGTGILIDGQNDTVQHNDVAGSRRRTATDADGVRFWGINQKITDNTIHDISQQGYPAGTEPHTDCFQTFDEDSPISYGVVIQNNKCVNVDAQCMIASGTARHNAGVPYNQIAIQFLDNYCQSGADPAVYLEGYPNVAIKGNTFSSQYAVALLAVQSAVNVKFEDNILVGQFQPFNVDPTSMAGFTQSNNVNK
jgi:parallel beta-helix repeat protein